MFIFASKVALGAFKEILKKKYKKFIRILTLFTIFSPRIVDCLMNFFVFYYN